MLIGDAHPLTHPDMLKSSTDGVFVPLWAGKRVRKLAERIESPLLFTRVFV